MQKKCKLYYPIRINSFFPIFTHRKIEDCIEIIKCNLCFKFNKNKTKKYLSQEKKIYCSNELIKNIFIQIRKTI